MKKKAAKDVRQSAQFEHKVVTAIEPVYHDGKPVHYDAAAVIHMSSGVMETHYKISLQGVIRYAFDANETWPRIYEQKISAALAASMLDTARKINPKFLDGRTAEGLRRELEIHYLFYKHGFMVKSTVVADMGALRKDSPGYDSNCWPWELFHRASVNQESPAGTDV